MTNITSRKKGSPFIAVDPGPVKSAWVEFELQATGWQVCGMGIWENVRVAEVLADYYREMVVFEWLSSYGKAVGSTVFETAYWVGRFSMMPEFREVSGFWSEESHRLTRREVKRILGLTKPKTTDSVVRKAMIERWGPLKLVKDEWQALALGTAFLIKEGELK